MEPVRIFGLVEVGQSDLASAVRAALDQAGPSIFTCVEEPEPEDFVESRGAACVGAIRNAKPDAMLLCSGQSSTRRVGAALSAARSVSPDLPVMFSAQGN